MSGADAITVNVRKLIFTLAAVVAVLFVACGPEPKSDDVVAQTAKVYYVAAVGALVDTARHQGNAFVMLTFADSTHEEIVVPMVYHNGVWYMR